jgi:hypothetical protein
MTTYTFHTDPGHGWLEVPVAKIFQFGIQDQISGYSYRNGDTAYLEEDCDANLFIQSLKSFGGEFNYREKSSNAESFIRNMPRFY